MIRVIKYLPLPVLKVLENILIKYINFTTKYEKPIRFIKNTLNFVFSALYYALSFIIGLALVISTGGLILALAIGSNQYKDIKNNNW